MSEADREVQAQLQEVIQELRSIHYRLLGLIASLPASDVNRSPEEDEAEDAFAFRAVVECVLVDRIRPAIQDLRSAAADVAVVAVEER